LFSSPSVIKKAADGIYNGVDAAIYTDQEKANGFMGMLKGYEPFKIAQRLLMLVIWVPYVLIFLMCAGMYTASGFMGVAQGTILSEAAVTLAKLNIDTLGTPSTLVVAFYFGGGALEGVVNRIRSKPG
jgi:hypothetical protein